LIQYLAIRNKLEKEIGILYRDIGNGLEISHAYQLNHDYKFSDAKKIDCWYTSDYINWEDLLLEFPLVYYERMWYTQEEYEALLAMRELTE